MEGLPNQNEQEVGLLTAGLCGKQGLGPAMHYTVKARNGGMDQFDANHLKQFDDRSGTLKRLVADALFDNVVL